MFFQEHGEEWAKKIQEEKFRWHNTQWLEMVGGARGATESTTTMPDDNFAVDNDDEDDDFLQNDDIFDQSDIFNGNYRKA